MTGKDDKNIYNEINILQEAFLSSCKKLKELKAKLDDKDFELEKDSARLNSLNRVAFVAEKGLKDMQNEISSFKWKISKMDDGLNSIDEELKRIDAELNDATVKKRGIDEETAQIESGMQQALNAIADIEPQRQEALSAVEKTEAEKAKVSEEVSELLSKTSINKDQSDAELNDLSLDFARHIGKRDHTKGVLVEREKVVGGLKDEIALLEEKCSQIEETIELGKKASVLKADIEKMEEEAQTSSQKANELQRALSDKEEKLNVLTSANVERKNSIHFLKKEVGPYDELVSKVQSSENKLSESRALIEQAVSDMKNLFSENNRMIEKLYS